MLERNAVKAARFVPRGLPGEQSPGGYSTQQLHHYYKLVRPYITLQYYQPCSVTYLYLSFSTVMQVPVFSLRAQIKLTPPLCRMPPRQ